MRISRIIIVALSVLSLSSCAIMQRDTGSKADPTPTDHSTHVNTPPPGPQVTPTSTPTPSDAVVLGRAIVSGKLGEAPKIKVDTSVADTTQLLTKDIAVGNGKAIESTSSVTVQYTGVGGNTGQVFDSSWSGGQPITFPLNGVIVGWQEGLIGVKEGGRRILVIPGPMAYGENPPSGSPIEPNETLIFVVDVLSVQ